MIVSPVHPGAPHAGSPSPVPGAAAAACLMRAAHDLLPRLEAGGRVDAASLRGVMQAAFGDTDASGTWDWKLAYEACEAALVLFLHRHGPALAGTARTPQHVLGRLGRLADLMPTHTRRSLQSQSLQQFSTPVELGYVAAQAAGIRPGERVLEPSAGTGLLAVFAALAGASLHLNEIAPLRADLLGALFAGAQVTRFDGAQIHDHLPGRIGVDVVLMNPPFSALAHVEGRRAEATLRHLSSALARLSPGGRLVAITGESFTPQNPSWREAFAVLQGEARLVFSAGLAGAAYARHGTRTPTRLSVFDKSPAADPGALPEPLGLAPDVATLLAWVSAAVPARAVAANPAGAGEPAAPSGRPRSPAPVRPVAGTRAAPAGAPGAQRLAYDITPDNEGEPTRLSDALYEPWRAQAFVIPGARPHPTRLMQSAAMASVRPPAPRYRPLLPTRLVEEGVLSDAQLETVILAGEAHGGQLAGAWRVDGSLDTLAAAPEGAADAVRFRRGFMLGDGTGAGKGRQAAAILLDNWLQGRRKALWVSRSDTLIEDAQRDWSALGMERLLVTPLSRFAQGRPITLAEGIVFVTYATLRGQEREGKTSRLAQLVDWLGKGFDGVVIFDESHSLQNAAGGKGERGDVAPSQQGRAGLRLQHALPAARVVYVSATGATSVHNLAYAQRLGLWGGEDFPFATRAEFVTAIEAGGVAAMEVLARDLRALGLYTARSLSHEGVVCEPLEHALTPAQRRIYDAYAGAFAIIHNNLDAAMKAANITSGSTALNPRARAAARSAFESTKQRFFGHLLTAMKVPSLISAITADLAAGHAPVVQIVSTGEALTERRLAEIDTSEWDDVRVDITPREYVLSYLQHSFPVQLHEPFTDEEGHLASRPVWRDGEPVICREAQARRDALITHLAGLPPVPGALDQIVQHFGTDVVAEVTGRSRRIVRREGRLCVETRPAAANLAETAAFMDDARRILVFSDAGGTGRSYHADLAARNQRLRVHYLLEPGWKADAAIQGLGRTNRTRQAQPPLLRPVATDVKAEKRFLSTIARRLDTLGAITRGQRQTGGQGLFRPQDNLEGPLARDALRQLYRRIVQGRVEGCTLQAFEEATGLSLTDDTGLREELPPITTFLNRLLALPLALQDTVFAAFEALMEARIEGARASGTLDTGLETLHAASFTVTARQTIHTHEGTGAQTRLLTLTRRERNTPLSLEAALEAAASGKGRLLLNERSGRAALEGPAPGLMNEEGEVEPRVRLQRPLESQTVTLSALARSHWREVGREAFAEAWAGECASLPAFTESTLHMVTGLLLPIWKRLPADSPRVYRLQTDEGERIIGRLVPADWARATLGGASPELSPQDAFAALMEGRVQLTLADGLALRRVRVMGAARIELTGAGEGLRDRLLAMGVFHEIIAWTLRLFVPTGDGGPDVLARLMARWPVTGQVCREAA